MLTQSSSISEKWYLHKLDVYGYVLVIAVIAYIFVKPFSFPHLFYVFQSKNLNKQLNTQNSYKILKNVLPLYHVRTFFQKKKKMTNGALYFCGAYYKS